MIVVLYKLFIAFLLIITFLQYLNRRKTFLLSKIPSPKKHPIIHNLWLFRKINLYDLLTELESWKNKLGSVFHFTLYPFHSGIFFVTDPDVVERLLFDIKDPIKPSSYKVLKRWLGEGLVSSSGEKWLQRHNLITASLSNFMMTEFVKKMNLYDDKFIEILKSKNGQSVEILSLVTNLTLDIVFDSAMGSPINALENPRSSYVQAVERMCEIIFERTFSPLKMLDCFYIFTPTYREEKKLLRVLHSLSKDAIVARRKQLEEALNFETIKFDQSLSLLDTLLKSGENLSDQDVTDEINSFIHGGHDTTTSAISFLLFNLAKHKDVQQNVYLEVKTLLFHDVDLSKALTVNDLTKLTYLDAVIQETLRLYPAVPLYGRQLIEEVTAGGFTFPKGAEIFFSPYLMGRDSRNFAEPLAFNPDRFVKIQHAENCFIQFSGGKRACIGKKIAFLAIKALISKLLINFELTLVNANEEMTAVMGLALNPKVPINIQFIERKKI